MYNFTVDHLPLNKSPGPDGVRNEWIREAPEWVHDRLFTWMQRLWNGHSLPAWLVNSRTILLYKKGDPNKVSNYRPIALASTIYKLYTRCLAQIIQQYAESNHLLSPTQEGFRPQRGTTRQIRYYLNAIETAHITNTDLYALYVDFSSAFNTIGHKQLNYVHNDAHGLSKRTDRRRQCHIRKPNYRIRDPYRKYK